MRLLFICSFILSFDQIMAQDTAAIDSLVHVIDQSCVLKKRSKSSSSHYTTTVSWYVSPKHGIKYVMVSSCDLINSDSCRYPNHTVIYHYCNNNLIRAEETSTSTEFTDTNTWYYSRADNLKKRSVCLPDIPSANFHLQWGKLRLEQWNRHKKKRLLSLCAPERT